jgi:hypothetical protein
MRRGRSSWSVLRSRVLTGEEANVNLDSVVEVPMDFKDAFDKDPEGSVRDYAGISTLAVTPYIVRRDLVSAMFQGAAQASLKHPFTRETVTLQDSDVLWTRVYPGWTTEN